MSWCYRIPDCRIHTVVCDPLRCKKTGVRLSSPLSEWSKVTDTIQSVNLGLKLRPREKRKENGKETRIHKVGKKNEADLLMVDVVPFVPQELPTASNAIHLPNPGVRIACLTGIQNKSNNTNPVHY